MTARARARQPWAGRVLACSISILLMWARAAGETVDTVAEEYALTAEQVRAALAYAAHVAAHLPPAVRKAS